MPIRMTGMASGIDVDAVVKELMSAQKLKKTNLEGKKEKLSWKQDAWKEMNTKLYSFYTGSLSKMRTKGNYQARKATASDPGKVSVSATTATSGSYKLSVENLASSEYVTGASLKGKGYDSSTKLVDAGMTEGQTITIKSGNGDPVELVVGADTKISDFVDKLKEAGLNASFDKTNGRFFISAKDSGEANKFTITSTIADGEGKGLDALGLMNITEQVATEGRTANSASDVAIVKASDAKIKLNGAVIESGSNTINVNGMKLDLQGTTAEGEEITLSITKDSQSVVDRVKDFIKGYNELMTEMYSKYNAASSRGYSMLTSEQKEAMSENDVKNWETKIKDSLLRRDDTLGDLMSTFRSAMQGTIEINGESFSLSSFGIVTGNYTEHGLLHLEGDPDDAEYATKTNKLMQMLEEDPDKVSEALSGIMDKFYNKMFDKMGTTKLSSALTFYNDKQMKTESESYEKQIKQWDTKLADIEDKYYKQFSTMEKMMAELQNKQSQMAGFFG
ncbi:MAG: flagellar filament capping protein FliD [Lachnospiraceae bacterium]|nr:flagellar filament capping protein FliD [Lachnospiraceae bacterium]